MLARLRKAGARANWDCGLHVHVSLEPWGEAMVLPLVDAALAQVLAVPLHGYPPPQPVPLWRRRQVWLEEALRPALDPLALAGRPGAEVHHLEPEPGGAIAVLIEHADNRLERRVARWQEGQWHVE